MALNAIGNLTFFSMSGPPVFAQQRSVARVRAGVDGSTVKLIGRYGDTWQTRTVQHTATFPDAVALASKYHESQKNLTNVVWEGNILAKLRHRYFVRDVRVESIEPMISSTTGDLARIAAVWELEPIRF